jgi:hypothetical protein
MAIKLDGLTSQKTIDHHSLKYPTENAIFDIRIFNLKILQIFSVFVKNLNHRSFGKSFDPRATCGPLFIRTVLNLYKEFISFNVTGRKI